MGYLKQTNTTNIAEDLVETQGRVLREWKQFKIEGLSRCDAIVSKIAKCTGTDGADPCHIHTSLKQSVPLPLHRGLNDLKPTLCDEHAARRGPLRHKQPVR